MPSLVIWMLLSRNDERTLIVSSRRASSSPSFFVYSPASMSLSLRRSPPAATTASRALKSSFSRPRVSKGNAFSESMFSTMKTAPAYLHKPFESVEAAEDSVAEFVYWYNNEHLHSGVQFVTPVDRHYGNELEILASREGVYAQARRRNPSRWSTATRD